MSTLRSLKRRIQKNNGTLKHKKVLAKKFGCSIKEVDMRLENRRKNLEILNMQEDE